ncbi:MAG TPA: hypothetical protein VFO38_04250 [Candidatus Saccharimonadales bacterium]|nr:hypothetical protein [Candidatus Saccharimonadales bacterium]
MVCILACFLRNYAEETAAPFEKALVAKAAIKQCARNHSGRTPGDSRIPSYSAIFDIPGNKEQAVDLVKSTAQESGFSLQIDTSNRNNPDLLLVDKTKDSPYPDLEAGKIILLINVPEGKTYNGKGVNPCTVITDPNPPANKTTIWINLNLPEYK